MAAARAAPRPPRRGDRASRAAPAWLREASDLHWHKLEEPAEAAALLQLAVSWYPSDATLRPALADVLEASGQWDEAALVLRDQVATYRDQRSKERALVHHRLAHALTRAGRADGALAELRMAAEMQPAHPAILYDLGRAALASGQLNLAESTYRALLLAIHHSIDDAEAGPSGPASRRGLRGAQRGRRAQGRRARGPSISSTRRSTRRSRAGRTRALRGAARARAAATPCSPDRSSGASSAPPRWPRGRAPWPTWPRSGPSTSPRPRTCAARIARHAERMYRELEHEGLTDSAAWTALAAAHRSFGDESARIAIMQRRATLLEAAIPNLKRGADRNRLRVELATTLLEDPSRHGDAVALLSSALKDNPGDGEAANRLADALERLGRFDELVVVLEGRLRAGIDRTRLRRGRRSGASAARSSAPDARRRRSRSTSPSSIVPSPSAPRPMEARRSLGGVGRVARCAGRAPRGARQRTPRRRPRADDRRPAPTRPSRSACSICAIARGTPPARRRALELGFAADPKNAAFFRRLVDAYREAGDPGGTLRLLDPAIAARPDDAELLLLRASARETLGDDDGALFDLETAAVADVRHADALLALHARVLERQRTARRVGPSPPRRTSTRSASWTCSCTPGASSEARRELERLLARSPAQADGLERMAALHGADGNWTARGRDVPQAPAHRRGGRQRRLRPGGPRDGRRVRTRRRRRGRPRCARVGARQGPREPRAHAAARAGLRDDGRCRPAREPPGRARRARARRRERPGRRRAHAAPRSRRACSCSTARRTRRARFASRSARARATATASTPSCSGPARSAGSDSRRKRWLRSTRRPARARGKRTPLLARLHLEAARAHLAIDEIVEAFDSLKAGFSLDWRNAEIAMLLGLVAIDLDDEKLAERALSGAHDDPCARRLGREPGRGAAGGGLLSPRADGAGQGRSRKGPAHGHPRDRGRARARGREGAARADRAGRRIAREPQRPAPRRHAAVVAAVTLRGLRGPARRPGAPPEGVRPRSAP